MDFKNILVICHSNIGDICYDLVVIDPLRRQFPRARISVLTTSRNKPIAQGYKNIDRIITFDRHAGDKGAFGRLRLMMKLRRERYDLAVVLTSSLMHKFLGIPKVLSLRKYLGCLPSETGRHAADSYLEFLRYHGIDAPKATFSFISSQEDKDFCNRLFAKEGIGSQDKVVGILPLASWSLKSWPIDQWNELAEALKKELSIKIIAFGDSENVFFKKLVVPHIAPEIILTGKTTLGQALAVIKRCNLFIAPDTGLLHLASIMGVEVIGLYGPSPKDYIYPYFHRYKIILPKVKLACMPCYPGLAGCECARKKLLFGECMKQISVDSVLAAVRQARCL